WDTPVGQGGVGLSVGQRQRLALTRALLDDSALVVLDEPTAHLDAVSEGVVVDTIRAMRDAGRTVVVIAHRAAVVAAADQVIEIRTRAATPEEIQEWPVLGEVESLGDVRVELPGLLDPALVAPAAPGAGSTPPNEGATGITTDPDRTTGTEEAQR
ncbi:MAG: ATP-binding cassette domain-containing protein, partial [Pauljensenia sp.]